MYKYLVVLFLLFSFANANELIEGSGVEDIKKENFKNITKFNIKTSIDTTVIKSKNSYYILIGDDNIIDEIDISFTDNELIVSTDKSFKTKSDLKLYIYSDKIRLIRVNGAMDLKLKSLNETSLDIVANGTIDISVMNKSIADKLSIVADGTIDIDFKNLKSRTTKLDLSGVCDVVLNSTNKPNLTSKGICDVVNLNIPKIISKTIIKKSKIIKFNKTSKVIIGNCDLAIKGKNIITSNSNNKTLYDKLIYLINENKIVKFKNTLAERNVNIYNIYSPTLLYQSSINGKLEFVKLLVNKGALINYKTGKYNETSLHGAIRAGKMNTAVYLLNKSINQNIKNAQGQTPLHLATIRGMNSLINYLIAKGANKRIRDNYGRTAYDIAKNMLEIDRSTLKLLNITLKSDIQNNKKISNSNLGVYIGR